MFRLRGSGMFACAGPQSFGLLWRHSTMAARVQQPMCVDLATLVIWQCCPVVGWRTASQGVMPAAEPCCPAHHSTHNALFILAQWKRACSLVAIQPGNLPHANLLPSTTRPAHSAPRNPHQRSNLAATLLSSASFTRLSSASSAPAQSLPPGPQSPQCRPPHAPARRRCPPRGAAVR